MGKPVPVQHVIDVSPGDVFMIGTDLYQHPLHTKGPKRGLFITRPNKRLYEMFKFVGMKRLEDDQIVQTFIQ